MGDAVSRLVREVRPDFILNCIGVLIREFQRTSGQCYSDKCMVPSFAQETVG